MQETNREPSTRKRIPTVAFVIVAFIVGAMFGSVDHQAAAQFREQPSPKKAFLSGGARSEKVLVEISATAKRIEGQLGRIEKSMHSMASR